MKAQTQIGANFLRKWTGDAPKGRTMAELSMQRGQHDEPRINQFDTVLTKDGIIKIWRF